MMTSDHEYGREEILKLIKSLKLTGMLEAYDDIIAETVRRKASSRFCLHQLLKAEVKTRSLKALQNRIHSAHFPVMKDLDDFIFADTPISSEQVMQLYSTEFIK